MDYGRSIYQLEMINVPPMHNLGFTGKGLLICILDAGFDTLSHEAFEQTKILDTWDFVNNDPNINNEDDMGSGSHGSSVLGVVGGFKYGELIGSAYGADFILGKTENSDWERHIEEDHWIAGAEWADKKGADIISTSLGYRDGFTNGERDYNWTEIDGETAIISKGANIAASKGILIIKSGGNDGYIPGPENTLGAPSGCDGVMAIGSVEYGGRKAQSSSVGPTADGRLKPDVMAMGVAVYTTSNAGPSAYKVVYGTSFACPAAAGAAALVWEANPGWSNWDIMDALRQTASLAHAPSREMGWGIIDTLKASSHHLKDIHPPRKFALKRLKVDYYFFTVKFDQLHWEPDFRNQKTISKYRVYSMESLDTGGMKFQLKKEVAAPETSIVITSYQADPRCLYKIIAVAEDGSESNPNYTTIY
jgi:subtilisin family serine protease